MLYVWQLSPEIANEVLRTGSDSITGFGIALFVSLSFNFLLWYELRSVHNRFIDHLKMSDITIQKIHDSIISKS